MIKRYFILLILIVFCGPSEAEIQERIDLEVKQRIDIAVEERLEEIENEFAEICFLIVQNAYATNDVHQPSITLFDLENKIVDFMNKPKWLSDKTSFNGNLNDFNTKKFNYEIYTMGYVLRIPINARYIRISADYGNKVTTDWVWELDSDGINNIVNKKELIAWRIGLEGNNSSDLLNNEVFKLNINNVRTSCNSYINEN